VLLTIIAVGHIDWSWPEVAHHRAELFAKRLFWYWRRRRLFACCWCWRPILGSGSQVRRG